jgi:hypothetical protein
VSGVPLFEDVTDAAGLVPLDAKSPHVDVADFDNDGWLDIVAYASTVASPTSGEGRPLDTLGRPRQQSFPLSVKGASRRSQGAGRFGRRRW